MIAIKVYRSVVLLSPQHQQISKILESKDVRHLGDPVNSHYNRCRVQSHLSKGLPKGTWWLCAPKGQGMSIDPHNTRVSAMTLMSAAITLFFSLSLLACQLLEEESLHAPTSLDFTFFSLCTSTCLSGLLALPVDHVESVVIESSRAFLCLPPSLPPSHGVFPPVWLLGECD